MAMTSQVVSIKPVATASSQIQYGTPVDAKDRQLLDAQQIAKQYGNINYDEDAIASIFRDQVDQEYAAKQAAYARTANQYYNRLGTSQNAYLDAMRKERAGAVMTGAAQGMQSSNALSALLGLSQQTSADNTMLTQEARALADQQAAAQAQARRDAMQYADQNRLAMATTGANLYGVDAQKYIGELGANAQVGAANIAASAQGYTADQGLAGTRYASDQNLAGTRYASDQNLKGVDLSSGRQLEGTQYSADKSLEGQRVYAGGMVQSANVNANASRYAANQNVEAQRIAGVAQVEATMQQNRSNILQTVLSGGSLTPDQAAQYVESLFMPKATAPLPPKPKATR